MEPRDHLKNLNDKLNQDYKIEDKEALWNELEPRLKRRRKAPVLLPFIIVTLIGGAALLWYIQSSKTEHIIASDDLYIDTSQTIRDESVTEDMLIESNQSETKYEMSLNSAEDSNQTNVGYNSTIQKNEIDQLSREHRQNGDSKDIIIVGEQPIIQQASAQELNAGSDSHTIQASNVTEGLLINSDIDHEVRNLNTEGHEPSTPQSIIATIGNAGAESIEDNNDLVIDSNSKITVAEKQIYRVPSDINEQNSNSVISLSNGEDSVLITRLIPAAVLHPIPYSQSSISLIPQAAINTPEDVHRQPWTYEVTPYFSLFRNIENRNNGTALGSELDKLTNIHWGYAQGLSISASYKKSIIFGVSLARNQFLERFTLNNEVESEIIVANDQAFRFENSFISQDQSVNRSVRQEALQYNKISLTELSPFIGYQLSISGWNVGVTASPLIRLSQGYTGYLIDDKSLLTTDIDEYYQNNNVGLSGLMTKMSLSRSINSKLNIGVDAIFGNRWSLQSEGNTDFNNRVTSVGIGLKLGYTI